MTKYINPNPNPSGGEGGAVTSVNGQTGDVTIDKTNLNLGNVTNDAQLKIASNLSDLGNVAIAKVNLSLVKSDVGLGSVDNTSDSSKPVSTAQQTALDAKVDENAPITGATKTKITYDTKGLVTAGADATQDDIGDGTTYKQYSATDKTKLAGIETGADVTDAANVDAAGATMNSDTSLAGNGYFVDEDNMASDSPSKVPSQQSVKAYVDSSVASAGGGDVSGPASSTDNAIARFNGITGKLIQNSGVIIDDSNNLGANGLYANTGEIGGSPITTASNTQTLTGKTIDGDNNTLQDIPTSAIKGRHYQTDNSNSVASTTNAPLIVQYGWGQMIGDGTARLQETVTFPSAFTTILGIMTSFGGAKAGVGANITEMTAEIGAGTAPFAGWSDPTTTSFTITLNRSSGTFSASGTNYFAYSWIAWGI